MTATATLDGTFALGTGSDYTLPKDRMPFLGSAPVRPTDQVRGNRTGSAGGTDTDGPRLIVWPFQIEAATVAEANQLHAALKAAFRTQSADRTLDVAIPGLTADDDPLRFYGRCRGTTADMTLLNIGYVTGTVIFSALDPNGYGPEDTTTGSGTFSVTNPGAVDTERAIITITGNGSTPALASTTTGGDITFVTALANGDDWIIDLRAQTVVDDNGTDMVAAGALDPGSLWFALEPGANQLVLTGAASASVALRGAYP